MSNEENLKETKKEQIQEKPFQKGWKNFVNGIKDGFENFQKSLEEQSKKNKEVWDENKDKINAFFKDVKQNWDNKVKEWNTEMEKKRLETKEQWEAHKDKISQDFKNWQEKTRQDWKEGVKAFRRGFFRAYLWILALIIPIIVIIIVILVVMRWLLG
ncbi:MAG: hypothetical protein JSV23_05570 [Promethearchaeota archaeon]|nr:MAG: hypothetical protein JSV23_05570 [Candidatus Lokiarchaeota archaeon]